MMADKLSIPQWTIRNPLGIIGLFISFIYAVSALVLGWSVGTLKETNESILILFITIFPVVVLGVFVFLVVWHHTKLYGPGDYRSDQGFLDASLRLASPESLGHRIAQDVARDNAPVADAQTDERASEGPARGSRDAPEIKTDNEGLSDQKTTRRIRSAYIAESLAFQELQNEFGGAVRRNVVLERGHSHYELDGIIEANGERIIVEVKFVRGAATTFTRRLRELIFNLSAMKGWLSGSKSYEARVIGVIVVDGPATLIQQTRERVEHGDFSPHELRVYSYNELAQKYGLPSDQDGDASE